MPEDEQVIIFRVLPQRSGSNVFEYLGIEEQAEIVARAMAHEQRGSHSNEMFAGTIRTAPAEELPSAAAAVDPSAHAGRTPHVANALLGYPRLAPAIG